MWSFSQKTDHRQCPDRQTFHTSKPNTQTRSNTTCLMSPPQRSSFVRLGVMKTKTCLNRPLFKWPLRSQSASAAPVSVHTVLRLTSHPSSCASILYSNTTLPFMKQPTVRGRFSRIVRIVNVSEKTMRQQGVFHLLCIT